VPYLSNFQIIGEMCETMSFTDLILSNKKVESLAKSMEEAKECRKCDLSVNNIVDVSMLKDM